MCRQDEDSESVENQRLRIEMERRLPFAGTVVTRRDTGKQLEFPAKMCLVKETRLVGDFAQGPVSGVNKVDSLHIFLIGG